MTKTGLSLYFASDRPGGAGGLDIYVSRRASINDPWGPPQRLGAPINTEGNDHCAYVTPDGHTMIFVSNRPGGLGFGDLYSVFRRNASDDLWENIRTISELNTAANEFGPTGFENSETGALTLYFNSDRAGNQDIFSSVLRADGTFSAPQAVTELNNAAADTFPVVRLDGLELALISNRTGTVGGNDIWISTRASVAEPWSAPVNPGPPLNSSGNDSRAWFYANGTRMVLFSNRSGGVGDNDLYEATRTRTTFLPAGSATGVGGATFRTVAQISNPSSTAIAGTLVFRPSGQAPSAADPRISYTLAPFETRTFADLMATFGTTGIGTVEVIPTTGPAPALLFRIDDGGSVTVPQIHSEHVLVRGSRGVLITPSDLTRFRLNIGIRTFANGVTMTVAVYSSPGSLIRTTTRTYPPNYFTLLGAQELVGGPIEANQTIVFSIEAGSAVVYGSSVSSTGQGSTLRLVTPFLP